MKLALVVAVVAGMVGCWYHAKASDIRKAFEHHEGQEFPQVKAEYSKIVGGESFVLSERWKNYQKYAKDCPSIAEVVQVEISKTSDGGEYVIRMRGPSSHTDANGFETGVCSLWVNGGKDNQTLEVRDFTPY